MYARGFQATSQGSICRRTTVLFGLMLLGALFVLGQPQRADAVPTCTRYWTGDIAGNAWGDTRNWSATDGGADASVPSATDFVCISTAPARSLAIISDYREVAGISFPDSATVHPNARVAAGGTLKVGTGAPNSYDSVIHNLTLQSSSAFGGTADVTAGTIGSLSGVSLGGGTGSLVLATGGVASTATGTQVQLSDGYRLVNNGAFTRTTDRCSSTTAR